MPRYSSRAGSVLDLAAPGCNGPVEYVCHEALEADVANLQAALARVDVDEAFMNAASPGIVADYLANEHYPDQLYAVLTARSLAQHPDIQTRQITAVAYCPGQVFGTRLAKELSLPLRIAWSLLGTPVGSPLRRLNRNLNSRTAAGHAMADLALGVATPPNGRTYAALRRGQLTWPDPSELARRDELAQAVWNDSARLVGLRD